MAWLKIDDGFVEHSRVETLTDRAFRLHVSALCLCARKLTDGRLTDLDARVVRTIARASAKHVAELEGCGLWEREPHGYAIRDYLDYNPSAEQVRKDREEARERMRKLRENGR
jgi:hypothetical protein